MGGMVLTADGGTTWTPLQPVALRGRDISSLEIRGQTLLVASDQFGGGSVPQCGRRARAFTRISGSNGLGAGAGLRRSSGTSSNATRYYAGVLGVGLFRSDDLGLNWTNVSQNDTTAPVVCSRPSPEATTTACGWPPATTGACTSRWSWAETPSTSASPPIRARTWTAMDLPRTVTPHPSTTISNASNTTPIVITTVGNHGPARSRTATCSCASAASLATPRPTGTSGVQALPPGPPTNQFTLVGSAGNGATLAVELVRIRRSDPEPPAGRPGGHPPVRWWSIPPTRPSSTSAATARNFAQLHRRCVTSADACSGATPPSPQAATQPSPRPQWAHLTHSNAVAATPAGGTASGSAPHADSRSMAFDAAGNLVEGGDGGIARRTSPARQHRRLVLHQRQPADHRAAQHRLRSGVVAG